MKTLKISETETIKLDESNIDDSGNIGLTLEQAQKYINLVFENLKKQYPSLIISKEQIDEFIDFDYNTKLPEGIISWWEDTNGKTLLELKEAQKYINYLFSKQTNIELETNNDNKCFVFTKQEIDEFKNRILKQQKIKSKK